MAFTYDISTDRGKIRMGLADTSAAHPIFTDTEIDTFLSEGGSVAEGINYGLRIMKSVAALRGEVERVRAIDEVLASRTALPTVTVNMPALLPMDAGWTQDNP
jgi:hypothetical protein